MKNKTDVSSRADIELFIRNFYEKVVADETIGIIFTQIVPINWEHHIPIITDFWETILLDNPVYKSNAMEVHYRLNAVFPLEKKHFDAWLNIFNSEMDKMYKGPVTELAKKRAKSIADLMLFNMTKNTLL